VRVGHQKGVNGRQTYKVKCKGEKTKISIHFLSCPDDRGKRFQINPGIYNHIITLFGLNDKWQF